VHYWKETGSGAHPASYPMGTGVFIPGIKRPGREDDHSPPSSAEVKNEGSYTSSCRGAYLSTGTSPLHLSAIMTKYYEVAG